MYDIILSITVLCAFALLAGSLWMWHKQGPSRHSILMGILSFVMLANVVIWVAPDEADVEGDVAGSVAQDAPQE